MLEPFFGELMIHPAALDFNGPTCSNGCAYCFAQSRKSDRQCSLKRLVDLCFGRSRSAGLVDFLFIHGFPVCLSNRTDPFAKSSERVTPTALKAMNDTRNPLYIQTKGGVGRDLEMLDAVTKRDVVVYVSVTSPRADVLRRVEPNAAPFEHRFRLLRYALSRGWLPVVGLNPLWPDWWTDSELMDFVDACLAAGIRRFVTQPLHMSRAMLKNLPPAYLSRLTPGELAGSSTVVGDKWDWYVRQNMAIIARGGKAFPVGIAPRRIALYEDAPQLAKRMRSSQEFVDFAMARRDAGEKGCVYTFADFLRVMTEGNPELISHHFREAYQYVMTVNRNVWRTSTACRTARTFADVYRVFWNNRRLYDSPQRRACFRRVLNPDGSPLLDRNGDIVICAPPRDWLIRARDGASGASGPDGILTSKDFRGKEVNINEADLCL